MDLIEVRVVIAGVADQLPCPFGEVLEELGEGGRVEVAGRGDADGSVGGKDGTVGEGEVALEVTLHICEQTDLEAAEVGAVTEGETPRLLERIADGVHGRLARDLEQGTVDSGEEVGMFVRVEMGHREPCGLQLSDLGEGFRADVLCSKMPPQSGGGKGDQGSVEALSVGANQGRNGVRGRDGGAVGEDDVAANAESRIAVCDGHRVREGRAICHEGCGAESAGAVKLFYRTIDADGEAEVVRVDDEPSGHGF